MVDVDKLRGRGVWLLGLRRINFIVTGLTASFILYTRSSAVVYFTVGALACSGIAKTLKRIIRQPRPIPSASKKKVAYGMPSTHSATITFFATYICLSCAYLPIHPSLPASTWTRILPPILAIPAASVIAASRVWLGKHTWPQIYAGCALGLCLSYIWFSLWTRGASVYGEALDDVLRPYIGWS